MNFFQQQDRAKSRSRILVLGFFLSILFVLGLLDLIIYSNVDNQQILNHIHEINLGVITLIFFGSLLRYFKIRKGGLSIAELVNATPIHRDQSDPKYQQLINVVDEISIAAGIAAPRLFVMGEEQGINAFVAGYNPNDTILVVTSGCLNNLSRDELQGVIAHEFSHIYNSDASLNLKLLIVLGGLVFISQAGYVMIRSRNDSKGQVTMIGAILVAFGYISLLCGSIIKAAISRQRESLADASAVQFTRNPEGLASALMKIEAQGDKALLESKHAEEISHMCFSKAQISECFGLFDTHPPLPVRIAAVDPTGEIRANFKKRAKAKPEPVAVKKTTTQAFNLGSMVPAAHILQTIGNPTATNYVQAEQMLHSVPQPVMGLLNTPQSAQALVYSILLVQDPSIDYTALSLAPTIKQQIGEAINCQVLHDPAFRLMLLDLAVPELKTLDAAVSTSFLKSIYDLIKADNKLNIFEALLFTILSQRLRSDAYSNIKVKYFAVSQLRSEFTQILAFIAQQGGVDSVLQQQAFAASLLELKIYDQQDLRSFKVSLTDLMRHLKKLRYMSTNLKQKFLHACLTCVNCDGQLAPNEAQLLRAVCACLNCPMPPF